MDAKTFLMGSGNPGFSFNTPGDRIIGQICAEPSMQQQKVFGTNDPAFWPSGDPKMQMLVPVQTNFRNYEGIANPDPAQPDTGARTIYVKGKHFERAAREAVRTAGASFLEVGGWLEVVYDGPDMTSKAGMKPKLYSVRYQRPQGQQPQNTFNQAQPQQGYGQQQNYAPRPPQATPQGGPVSPQSWQQPGWGTQQPQAQQWTAQPTVPSHHGQEQAMPDWARPASSPPSAQSSSPPAPSLSTLDMIRQAGESGTPDYGPVEPAF